MSREDHFIYLTKKQLTEMNLKSGSQVKVTIGSAAALAYVKETNKEKDVTEAVTISKSLSRVLGIPDGSHLNITRSGDAVRIGPLVGIIGSEYISGRQSFGAQDSFFRKLLALLGTEYGVGYVFTPDNVNWNKKMVYGYTLTSAPNGKWVRGWFALPDICYNRHFPSKASPSSQGTVKRMMQNGVVSFNGRVGSKWGVFKKLNEHSEISPYLPETRLLNSSKVLSSALRKHSNIYVKPVNGCKGQDILKIQKENNGYLVKQSKNSKIVRYKDIADVYRHIRAAGHPKNLIVQPSIKTAFPTGHFDLRVMVQKNDANQWSVSGVAARVGKKGQITTNLHTGGHAAVPEDVFRKCGFSHEKTKAILYNIDRLAVKIARILEKTAHPLGELGLDFIIDQDGGVWFLEANPKPSRKSFADIEAHQVRRITILRPMQYAKYLAGF